MIEFIKKVEKFHRVFGSDILDTPQIPSEERQILRMKLMVEELEEIGVALRNNDLVEATDGLGDLLYVTFGSIIELGLTDVIEKVFNEIHRSNMTKACSSREEAIQTMNHYARTTDFIFEDFRYVEKDDSTFVVKRIDGKIMKSINYSEADLKSILYPKKIVFEDQQIVEYLPNVQKFMFNAEKDLFVILNYDGVLWQHGGFKSKEDVINLTNTDK